MRSAAECPCIAPCEGAGAGSRDGRRGQRNVENKFSSFDMLISRQERALFRINFCNPPFTSISIMTIPLQPILSHSALGRTSGPTICVRCVFAQWNGFRTHISKFRKFMSAHNLVEKPFSVCFRPNSRSLQHARRRMCGGSSA